MRWKTFLKHFLTPFQSCQGSK